MKETEAFFYFIEGFVPEIKSYVQLQQPKALQQAVQVVEYINLTLC